MRRTRKALSAFEDCRSSALPVQHITLETTDERSRRSSLPLFVGRSKDSAPIEQHLGAPGLTSLKKEGAGDGRTVENYPQQHTPWWKQDAGVFHSQGRAAWAIRESGKTKASRVGALVFNRSTHDGRRIQK